MPRTIDLNCDLGEAPASAGCELDEQLLAVVSSANIACGGHAGDDERIRRTVALAQQMGVAIGAHPSFPDREHFGRREMQLSSAAVADLVEEQARKVQQAAESIGGVLHHLKPHGALYHQAAHEPEVLAGMIAALRKLGGNIHLIGLAGSWGIAEARRQKISVLEEFFADRHYQADGNLVPRSDPDGVIHDAEVAAERVLLALKNHVVRTRGGSELPLRIDTVCLHSDTPQAIALAKTLRSRLLAEGIAIAAPKG